MGETERVLNLYERMLVAMDKVRYVQKTKSKEGELKFSIVSHDAVTAICREALREAGVYAYPEITKSETAIFKQIKTRMGQTEEVEYVAMTIHLSMHFVNVTNPDERFAVPMVGVGVDRQAQQDKCSGKAVSYAVKYAYLKALALETGDDPDFEQTRGAEKPAAPPAPEPDDPALPANSTSDSTPHVRVVLDGTARGMFNVCCQEISGFTGMKYALVKQKGWKMAKEHFGHTSLDTLTIEQGAELCLFLWAEMAPEHAPKPAEGSAK